MAYELAQSNLSHPFAGEPSFEPYDVSPAELQLGSIFDGCLLYTSDAADE